MNIGCNDIEMQAECKRAEWELVDWVNAVMNYGRTISLETAINDPTFNVSQEAINFVCLSSAIEKDRLVPDCATGLYTCVNKDRYLNNNTKIGGKVLTKDAQKYGMCTSVLLLQQCEKVQNGITNYIDNIMIHLRNCSNFEFSTMMEHRIVGSIIHN